MKEDFEGSVSSKLAKEAYKPLYRMATNTNIPDNLILGRNTTSIIQQDAKLIGFTMAKYKFAGKMFESFESVLEIGCMDGFGSLILSQFVRKLTSIDFFKEHIIQATKFTLPNTNNIEFKAADFLDGGFSKYDGIVAFDVLEHIDPSQEQIFMQNIVSSLSPHGVFIVGIPSLESQAYASELNRSSHINCKSSSKLSELAKQYFYNVFPFAFNDEVLHTGFAPMCQYLVRVCSSPKV